MDIGMLWLNTDKSSDLFSEINSAAKYYQKKHGHFPNLCFVNPSLIEKINRNCNINISIKPDKTILPGQLWIGVDEKLPTGTD